MEWVRREFKCEECDSQKRPSWRRRGAIPRTYRFNKIVACDLFYLNFQGMEVPVMNVIDHGIGYQACQVVQYPSRQGGGKTAREVYEAFMKMWVATFGPPRYSSPTVARSSSEHSSAEWST